MVQMESGSDRSPARSDATEGALWGVRLAEHQARLTRMVAFRLDARLRARIEASDVVQDAFLEAISHRAAYERNPELPLFLWLRGIVNNKLLELHRHHLGTHMRDAAREVTIPQPVAGATSALIVQQLAGHATGPTTAAARDEVNRRLTDALNSMEPIDHEVLALRHFEQLTNGEAARVLDIQERAAAKRYLRALKRLKEALANLSTGQQLQLPQFGVRSNDVTAPGIASKSLLDAPVRAVLTFDEAVAPIIGGPAIELRNSINGQLISAGDYRISFASNVMTLDFPTLPQQSPPAGMYRITIPAGAVRDLAGNATRPATPMATRTLLNSSRSLTMERMPCTPA